MVAEGTPRPWHPARWQRMSPAAARRLRAQADAHPAATPVDYPDWYLQRWHFLPAGYLSRRSVAGYDALIRRLYHASSEDAVHRAVVRALRPSRPDTVVDLGCGTGRLLARLAQAFPGAQLTGVDLSPFMLEAAASRASRDTPRLIHASAAATGLPTASADAVIALHLLGHIPAAEASRVLAEAHGLLAPGGLFVAVDHTWHHLDYLGFRIQRTQSLARGLMRLTTLEPAPVPPASPALQSQHGDA